MVTVNTQTQQQTNEGNNSSLHTTNAALETSQTLQHINTFHKTEVMYDEASAHFATMGLGVGVVTLWARDSLSWMGVIS